MSKIGSLFGKKKRKDKENQPTQFNGLYQFKHSGIISNSQGTENILRGNELSDTLYLETNTKPSSIGFIFLGKTGTSILSEMKKRHPDNFPSSLVLSSRADYETSNIKLQFIEVPSHKIEDLTFKQGYNWYEANQENLLDKLSRLARDFSIIFVFTESNGFYLEIANQALEFLSSTKTKPVLVQFLPFRSENKSKLVNVLANIYNIMKKDDKINIPYVLFDENILAKINSSLTLEDLSLKFYNRVANIFSDIILASQTTSKFYQTDFSNLVRIFENARGPCRIASFDIYDNNPGLSGLLDLEAFCYSFQTKQLATRGYVVVQPGPAGLNTKDYKRFRESFSNLDIILNIQENRQNGAIIRGIFTYNQLPKNLLESYENLYDVYIEILDEEYNLIEYFDLSNLGEIVEHERYRVNVKVREEK